MSTNRYRSAASGLPKPDTKPESPPPPPEDDRDEVRQTLYMPRGVYDQLRALAYTERTKMQKLVREGLNMLFADRALPSWDEAKREGELEAKRRGEQS